MPADLGRELGRSPSVISVQLSTRKNAGLARFKREPNGLVYRLKPPDLDRLIEQIERSSCRIVDTPARHSVPSCGRSEPRMQIRNAVILAAGRGTRLLPSTKAQPKEMLPVGRKPLVQYVVEELEANGVESLLFVTGRRKRAIEDHFDEDVELTEHLQRTGRTKLLDDLRFEHTGTAFFYTRQSRQLGTGHAVACAREFAGDEPFAVAMGDSIIVGEADRPLIRRMMDTYGEAAGGCVIAFREVPPEATSRYGVALPDGDGDVFEVRDLVEKPAPGTAPSNLAIAARYILPPGVFDIIDETPPAANGEIQLTDTFRLMIQRGFRVLGVRLAPGERRCDVGNFGSYCRTFIDFALADPEVAGELTAYLRERLSNTSGN
jgi:UTP--glucose-1-phosphate uridylyltransferase